MVLTIGSHGLKTGDKLKLGAETLKFTCAMDGNSAQKTYPRRLAGDGGTDPFFNTSINVDAVGSTQHTATDATYVPTTGVMTLEINGHNFNASTTHTVTGAQYNAKTGVMKMTLNGHGFTPGDQIKFSPNALTFQCTMDSGASNHTYPRSSDPVANKWLTITSVTTNTFEVIVGKSPIVQWDVSNAEYDQATGHMILTTPGPHGLRGHSDHTVTSATYTASSGLIVLTIPNHGFSNGDKIRIADHSLTFT